MDCAIDPHPCKQLNDAPSIRIYPVRNTVYIELIKRGLDYFPYTFHRFRIALSNAPLCGSRSKEQPNPTAARAEFACRSRVNDGRQFVRLRRIFRIGNGNAISPLSALFATPLTLNKSRTKATNLWSLALDWLASLETVQSRIRQQL
jgi:hypothetical protein